MSKARNPRFREIGFPRPCASRQAASSALGEEKINSANNLRNATGTTLGHLHPTAGPSQAAAAARRGPGSTTLPPAAAMAQSPSCLLLPAVLAGHIVALAEPYVAVELVLLVAAAVLVPAASSAQWGEAIVVLMWMPAASSTPLLDLYRDRILLHPRSGGRFCRGAHRCAANLGHPS